MKIPFKAIAVLIILSLIGVFAYQAYWLTGLYSSMKKDMDNCLAETLQVSDYNEMMARCDSLKRNSNIDKYIKSSFEVDSIMTHAGNSYGIHIPNRIGLEINEPLSSTVDKNGTLELLTKYFQRGIHSQLDLFTDYAKKEAKEKEEQKKRERERRMQEALLTIKKKYGKNAVLRGMNFEEGATAKERNGQIGGHQA